MSKSSKGAPSTSGMRQLLPGQKQPKQKNEMPAFKKLMGGGSGDTKGKGGY